MSNKKKTKKLKKQKSLLDEILSIIGIVILIFSFRWLLVDPFVIPSGSMIPSLLIRDHIAVHKMAYGIRKPFASKYLWRWGVPERGDVVVFRSTEDRKFMVKRVVALPGESLFIDEKGQIWIDNKELVRSSVKEPQNSTEFYQVSERSLGAPYSQYDFFEEQAEKRKYRVIQERSKLYSLRTSPAYTVPKDAVFVLGDNRDSSQDSRYWGPLPLDHIMGRAFGIWLSCEESIASFRILCNPLSLRWKRLFSSIK